MLIYKLKYTTKVMDDIILEINGDDSSLVPVEIELTEDEFDSIKKAAEYQGITIEDFVAKLLEDYSNYIENQGDDLID